MSSITVGVLLNIVEFLGSYILRTEIPVILKERIFHLLAEVLRILHLTAAYLHKSSHGTQDDQVFFPSSVPSVSSQSSTSFSILTHLQAELKHLYREEMKQWISGLNNPYENSNFTSYFHVGFINFLVSIFLFYFCFAFLKMFIFLLNLCHGLFQALMELCLAISEVTTSSAFSPLPELSSLCPSSSTEGAGGSFSFGSLVSSLVGDYAHAASTGLLSVALNAPPSSPSALGKRKRLKAKRDGDKSSPKPRSGSSSPRSSEVEVHSNGKLIFLLLI